VLFAGVDFSEEDDPSEEEDPLDVADPDEDPSPVPDPDDAAPDSAFLPLPAEERLSVL
jgi:hypothetical protein